MIGGYHMNMVLCGEECRWQKDGQCTLDDLSKAANDETAVGCRYFERADDTDNQANET